MHARSTAQHSPGRGRSVRSPAIHTARHVDSLRTQMTEQDGRMVTGLQATATDGPHGTGTAQALTVVCLTLGQVRGMPGSSALTCPECVMTRRSAVSAAPGPLEGYAARFDGLFGSLAQRRGFREYLAGLRRRGSGTRR